MSYISSSHSVISQHVNTTISEWCSLTDLIFWKVSYDLLPKSSSHASVFYTVLNHLSHWSVTVDDPHTWISHFLQCWHLSSKATLSWQSLAIIQDILFLGMMIGWLYSNFYAFINTVISIDEWLQLSRFVLQWVAFFLGCIFFQYYMFIWCFLLN